jgi:AraC family transcriptional regulator
LPFALSVGFGSGEAFARAFKKQFGQTPSQWQTQGPQARIDAYCERLRTTPSLLRNPDQADRKNDQAARGRAEDDGDSFPPTERSSTMQQPTSLIHIQLIERQPVRLAYLRHIGSYGPSVSRFWGERLAPFMLAHQFGDRPRYGIGHDDPSITADEKCRYDACVEVPEDFAPSASNPVDRGVGLSSLPGGRYVSARFEGNTDTMGPAWMWLFRTGLPEKGLVPGDTACFEHYWPSARFDAATGWFECDLCVPVA